MISKSRAQMSGHVALLGDSVLDNGAYTSGGPDVVRQLTSMLPAGWRASLLALDGAMMGDLEHQLYKLPADVTHLVVSIGGNDVLQNLDVLRLKARSSLDALLSLGKRVPGFERGYRAAVDRVGQLGLPTTICTIYNGNLSGQEGAAARIALMAFNGCHPACGVRVEAPGDRPPARVYRASRLRQPD